MKLLLVLSLAVIQGCNHLYYYPDAVRYETPNSVKLAHEEKTIKSLSGNDLKLWFIPSQKKPDLGTVIHFHGNAQNMSAHFLFVFWFAHLGYNVVTFDYSGYGISTGTATRENTVLDGQSILQWARRDQQISQGDIFIVGQSLGGAIAVSALARVPEVDVNGLIIESSFSSYRALARAKLGQSFLTWAFQWPLSLLISDDFAPVDDVQRLKTPILIVDGSADRIVPPDQSDALFESAPGPKQRILVPNGSHTPGLGSEEGEWRRKIVEFMCENGRERQKCLAYLESFSEIDNLGVFVEKDNKRKEK
jgi:uncharacterized protein